MKKNKDVEVFLVSGLIHVTNYILVSLQAGGWAQMDSLFICGLFHGLLN